MVLSTVVELLASVKKFHQVEYALRTLQWCWEGEIWNTTKQFKTWWTSPCYRFWRGAEISDSEALKARKPGKVGGWPWRRPTKETANSLGALAKGQGTIWCSHWANEFPSPQALLEKDYRAENASLSCIETHSSTLLCVLDCELLKAWESVLRIFFLSPKPSRDT